MLKDRRTEKEIMNFFEKFTKKIAKKLDAIRLRSLSSEEIKRTDTIIKKLERDLKKLERDLKKLTKIFEKLVDPTIKRGTENKRNSVDLFDDSDFDEFDGIEIFSDDETEDNE